MPKKQLHGRDTPHLELIPSAKGIQEPPSQILSL